jgi:hypothetical protein
MPVAAVMCAAGEGQLGVGEHHLGEDLRREDHALEAGVVAQHAGAADLGAGAAVVGSATK